MPSKNSDQGSFSYAVKQELCKESVKKPHCALAELAGILHMSGSVYFGGGQAGFKLVTEHDGIVTRVFSLVKAVFQIDCELLQSQSQLQKEAYTVRFAPPDFQGALSRLAFQLKEGISIDPTVFSSLTERDCCKAAYVRGAFLGGGSMSDPSKTYHLEFVSSGEAPARFLISVLGAFEIPARCTERKENFVVYIKDAESVLNCLALMGAHSGVLQTENIRILKGIRNNVNRQVNWENANIDRTIRSAMEQTEHIKTIEARMGLAKLSKSLREAAELRLSYPEASLSELAALTEGATRSAMNNRFRKLAEIAETLKISRT